MYNPALNPGMGGPIHGQQIPGPAVAPTGQFPLNPAAASAPVVAQTPVPGSYYPGAEGAPSGIMTPGVQAVSGAIASMPGVGNGAPMQHQKIPDTFDHNAYRSAIQAWHAQRQPGMDPAARQDWRADRPMHPSFMATPVV